MILLVDHDPTFLEKARSVLAPLTTQGVFLADNAGDALQAVQQLERLVSVALVDLDLDDGRGLALIAQMRQSYPNLPVIAIGGEHRATRLESSKSAGAVEVLEKPIDAAWTAAVGRARRHLPPDHNSMTH